MAERKKPLWTCPKCRHRFVTRNMWHSCSRHVISEHFKGTDPLVRLLFDRLVARVRESGAVHVDALKTGIVFQVRVRFAGAAPKKHWLACRLWLKRRVDDPRFYRVETVTPRDHVHHFRLSALKELDDPELMELIKEAYRVGCQEQEPDSRLHYEEQS